MPFHPHSASSRRSYSPRAFLRQKASSPKRGTRRLSLEALERRELFNVGPAEVIVNLEGTDGDDVLEFAPGNQHDTWLVTLNGNATQYQGNSIYLTFNGGKGNDSATLKGNGLADSASLSPGEGTLTSSKYFVDVDGTETISVDAGGGANEAVFYGSDADDVMSATPDSATMSGDGYVNSVSSVSQVRAHGGGGDYDLAFMQDNPNAPDRFMSGPGWAKLIGDDFGTRAFDFTRVYAYATSGDDTAVLDDLPGSRDKIVIKPDVTKFNGKGGAQRLFGFADVRADATPGDNDIARIYGEASTSDSLTVTGSTVVLEVEQLTTRTRGFFDTRIYGDDAGTDTADLSGRLKKDDKVILSPKYAKVAGDGFRVRAYSFGRTVAHAEAGSGDTVIFYDSANQADTFVASADLANLYGLGYNYRADGFATVYAFATRGGGDKARLFAGNDEQEYFEADPKVGVLRSATSHIQVRHFDRVNGYAEPDSTATAVMYTSEGTTNKFTGGPESGMLRGDDFARQAIGFENLHVYADPYTKHIARLQDSEHDDALVATSEYGELSGDDYSIRVVSFYEVTAEASNGGDDEAVFYDTDGVDHLEADSSRARITRVGLPRDFSVEATTFEHVQMYSSNDDDIKDVSPGSVQWISPSSVPDEDTGHSVEDEAADHALTELSEQTDDRPNVLYLAVDDLNDWIGALGGYANVQTPNLDRLAARGVTFSQAYTPAPLCNPSRSAVLTGYYPTTSGVYKNTEDWRVAVPDAVTLPELFKENGYETVGGGKILHWNDRAIWDEYHPRIPNPTPTADVRQDESSSTGFFSWASLDVPDEEMSDGLITSWAADYLHEQHDSPFFLACGVFRPHIPLEVPQQYYDLYPLNEIELPEVLANDLDDLPDAGLALAQTDEINAELLEDGNREELIQGYLASVTFADAQIGKVLDALESSEYADNTIVALWSDHGMHFGEKTHWKKGTLWEEATRVPLIVAGPGVAEPGSTSEHPVDLVSLYPTLADLCNLPVDESLDGVSLRPLLEDPDAEWNYPALMNFRDANAVRYEHWRYIRYGDGSEELYDHRTDPNEWTNLANDPSYDAVKAELAAMLPEKMALETPKRLNSALHWDTIEPTSIPEPLVSDERLFFSNYDASTGRELWVTDGETTPAPVADINPGTDSSNPAELVDWQGVTYFSADDGEHGSELWRTDGTALGTWMVSDIWPGIASSEIDELIVAEDKLYFRANDGTHGVELWCSDGTGEGTRLVADVVEGEASSYPSTMTAVGGKVFFQAYHPSTGAELWRSDGTDDGTRIVADILPGTGSSIPRELTAAEDGVFFHANDGVHGREIWFAAVEGGDAHLLQDHETGADGSNPEQLTYSNGALYFVAEGDGGRGLWKRDISEDSAQILHHGAGKGPIESEIGNITPIGSVVYFQASGSGNGPEPWRTDGTQNGTTMLRDIQNGQLGSYPSDFVALGDQVVFAADDGVHGMELWSTDGTHEGTALLTDLYPGERASEPRFLRKLGDTLLFFATNGDAPYQLWQLEDGIMRPVGNVSP